MQLSGLGWIELLEQLHDAQPATQPWRGQALACPRCRKPLHERHNRTRWGLFVANTCPDRHGALQSHAMLLAERGLLRTPTPADRAALVRQRGEWTCLNCGAPAGDAQRADCGWCRAPLLLFDFERLASALLPQPQNRATVSAGRLDVWPCQGCGQAIDPTAHGMCPQCGQVVLARSIAELQPLLRRLREHWQAWLERPQPAIDDSEQSRRRARADSHWLQVVARRMVAPVWPPSRVARRLQLALAVVLMLTWWWLYR
jgi:uncharacterized paraquat-inducible protein A